MIIGIVASSLSADSVFRIGVTVPMASVGAVLSNFPVFVDLDDMPSDFWDHVASGDGRDIRVKDEDGVDLPFDLVDFSPQAQNGCLFFKQSLSNAGDTVAYIHYGDSSLDAVAPGASNGREAVWADYERVFTWTGGAFLDRAGNGSPTRPTNAAALLNNISTSANLGVHQGVTWDGTHYYVTDTNAIKKYDAAFSLIAQNTNPLASIAGTDHCGDPCVVGHTLYIPVETYVDINTWSDQHIALFDARDLSFIAAIDVSAQGEEVSSICHIPETGGFYVSSFNDGSKLTEYDSALNYVGDLALSSTIPEIQGVTIWRDQIFVNSDNTDGTICIDLDGTVRGRVYGITGGAYEGLGHTDDALLLLHDTTGSSTGVVRRLEPYRTEAYGGVNLSGSDPYLIASAVARFTTWTLGASANLASKGQNRTVVSYTDEGTSFPDQSIRTGIVFRSSTDRWGIWNNVDSWLTNTSAPSTGTVYRLHQTHNGTTDRKLYVDGTQFLDSGCAARPAAAADCLYVGVEDLTLGEEMNGAVGFLYLRSGELTQAWISAEVQNLRNDIGGGTPFYTVGTEEELGVGVIAGFLPGVALNESYSRQLSADGATAWSITSGALPAGLTLNTSTGEIYGVVPVGTTLGNYTFEVTATGAGPSATESFTIGVGRYVTLLHGNGTNGGTTFTDETGKTWTASGNVQTSTDGAALGGSSLLFDGNSDYLTAADHADWTLGTADWTMECYVTLGSNVAGGTFPGLIGQRTNVGVDHSWSIFLDPSPAMNQIGFACNNNAVSGSSAVALTAGVRRHIAVSRRSSRLYFHVNGVPTAAQNFTENLANSSAVVRIGAFDTPAWSGSWFDGRMNELRFMVGAARYAEADSFDPSDVVELSDFPVTP